MEIYKIINDEEALVEFIQWLPDLQENEKFYLSLFARKKYCPDLIKSNDKTQLKRFTATKENMLDKIKQLEIPLGRWKLREIEAPQESLVLYIMPNPRCMKKATKMMGKHCWDLDRSNNFNLHAEATSCIQKSKSRACFVDFDIDTKENIDLTTLSMITKKRSYDVIETRGGFHILVKPDIATQIAKTQRTVIPELNTNNYPENWHKAITDMFNVDQSGDMMIPVIGCCQSDFTPKFINT